MNDSRISGKGRSEWRSLRNDSPVRSVRMFAAIIMVVGVLTAAADGLPTHKVSYDFMGMVVELTVDSMPNIHKVTIFSYQRDGKLVKVLDKTAFEDWKGGVTRFRGIAYMGSDVDIITVATGTGAGTYYLHKYRIQDGVAKLIKSERIYDWGLRPPNDKLVKGKKRALVLKQDPEDPWNVHFDVQ